MVRIKICGITNKSDALAAVKLGADALGFIFYKKSPRSISIADCRDIIKDINPFILKVGVFVNEKKSIVLKTIKQCRLNAVQFHGEESPAYCNYFKKYALVIKAFRLKDEKVLKEMKKYTVDAYLIDTYDPLVKGGTGKNFNLKLAKKAAGIKRPLIISGGLRADNVISYLKVLKPDAVDAASGVEEKPGKKNLNKLKIFLGRIKSYAT